MISPEDLREAAEACASALRPYAEQDWEVPAGDLAWTARRTLDHTSDALSFYAGQLAARADRRGYWPRNGDPWAGVAHLIELLPVHAAILAEVAIAAGPKARAFHPAGLADTPGFLGIACDELLVHTSDIAEGLAIPFTPPERLCHRVVRRIFPWAPDEFTAWEALRWANGRTTLPGHDRLDENWYWHVEPLDEWDGTIRRRTHPAGWS